MNNSKGFTLAEGILSLGGMMMIAALLFPLMFLILQKQIDEKQDLTAARVLYEHLEEYVINGTSIANEVQIDGVSYQLFIENNPEWKACVYYAERNHCIKEETKSDGLYFNRMYSYDAYHFDDLPPFPPVYQNIRAY